MYANDEFKTRPPPLKKKKKILHSFFFGGRYCFGKFWLIIIETSKFLQSAFFAPKWTFGKNIRPTYYIIWNLHTQKVWKKPYFGQNLLNFEQLFAQNSIKKFVLTQIFQCFFQIISMVLKNSPKKFESYALLDFEKAF